ncbi:hypothetical protein KBD75_00150 [Candidatus Woesebacteria bacterium]|nr:hypothetical protein [Candidatus Woesebacteria bacterium]
MRIAIVYNPRPTGFDRTDPRLEKHIEGDEWKTIEAIGQAIMANSHSVKYFPIDENIYEMLKASKPNLDLVFNLSEGISDGADREAHIPMICEILGLPYTGPGPLSAGLILNKSRAKQIWRSCKVSTAPWQLFVDSTITLNQDLHYPLIVKPNSEGSGIGIKSNSIVHDYLSLQLAVENILTQYDSDALVEELLPGREFTVALIGNGDKLITLPIVEINFNAFPKGAPSIDSYEAKFVYGATGQAEMLATEFCPAVLDLVTEAEINNLSKQAFLSIGARDFARVDLRMDANGKVYVMEINHPPGLMSDPNESSFFTIAGRAAGLTFAQMIGRILDSAITRLA